MRMGGQRERRAEKEKEAAEEEQNSAQGGTVVLRGEVVQRSAEGEGQRVDEVKMRSGRRIRFKQKVRLNAYRLSRGAPLTELSRSRPTASGLQSVLNRMIDSQAAQVLRIARDLVLEKGNSPAGLDGNRRVPTLSPSANRDMDALPGH